METEVKKLGVGFTCTNDGILAARDAGSESIGDWVMLTSIPENFYKLTNDKIYDIHQHWAFDNNPYVDRSVTAEQHAQSGISFEGVPVFDTPIGKLIDFKPCWFKSFREHPVMLSLHDNFMAYLGSDQLGFLRHPRLYKFEDSEMIPNRLIIHAEGAKNKRVPRIMNDDVIQYILDKYKNYDIIQVGGSSDKVIEGTVNNLGMDYWEVVELIASCSIFIGIDSGPFHIAQAYPRINRKLIVTTDQLEKKDWMPDGWILDQQHDPSLWYDWDTMFYNELDRDVGLTTSYLKI